MFKRRGSIMDAITELYINLHDEDSFDNRSYFSMLDLLKRPYFVLESIGIPARMFDGEIEVNELGLVIRQTFCDAITSIKLFSGDEELENAAQSGDAQKTYNLASQYFNGDAVNHDVFHGLVSSILLQATGLMHVKHTDEKRFDSKEIIENPVGVLTKASLFTQKNFFSVLVNTELFEKDLFQGLSVSLDYVFAERKFQIIHDSCDIFQGFAAGIILTLTGGMKITNIEE